MSRPVPLPDRATIPAAEQGDFDEVHLRLTALAAGGALSPYYSAVLNAPPMAAALSRLGVIIRAAGSRPGSYSDADREWVDQVLAADWGTDVVQRRHLPDAVAAGVRLEAIEAIRSGRLEELTADERFLTDYVRAVEVGKVSDEQYAALERRLDRRGAVEYTIFITFLMMTIRLQQALGVPPPPADEIESIFERLREGDGS